MTGQRKRLRALPLVLALVASTVTSTVVLPAVAPVVAGAVGGQPSGTLAKAGIVAETGSTSSVRPGETINWVLSYGNTSGTPADVRIDDPIGALQTYVPGTFGVPPGFARAWSADSGASFGPNEPPAGTTNIRAGAADIPDGATGNLSYLPSPDGGFQGSRGGGDGTYAIFFGANVYNVHHHRPAGRAVTLMECHNKSSGAVCPGWGANGSYFSPDNGAPMNTGPDRYLTPLSPGAEYIDPSGKLYFPVGVADGGSRVGVACVDLATERSCGFTQLAATSEPDPGGDASAYADISGNARIGSRSYWVMASGLLLCFDTSTLTACAGFPVRVAENLPGFEPAQGRTVVEGFGRYVFGSLTRSLKEPGVPRRFTEQRFCLDTATNTSCRNYPIRADRPDSETRYAAPYLNAAGEVIGACWYIHIGAGQGNWDCRRAGNGNADLPVPPWQIPAANSDMGFNGYGSPLLLGTRLYTSSSRRVVVRPPDGLEFPSTYNCFDFATNAICAGTQPFSSGIDMKNYSIRQDPALPECLWAVGDVGRFEIFNTITGAGRCSTTSTRTTPLTPTQYYCDGGQSHVSRWATVTIADLAPANYRNSVVTLRDGSGAVVPGFDGVSYPASQQTIDISSIPVTGNTATLSADVRIVDANPAAFPPNTAARPRVEVRWAGDAPQVCFRTSVGQVCNGAPAAIANTAAMLVSVPGVGSVETSAAAQLAYDISAVCAKSVVFLKTSDQMAVRPGAIVRYTVTVTNNGQLDFTDADRASFTDDLVAVLDDATYNGDGQATAGNVGFDGRYLGWFGPVAVNTSVTVTYTVTVNRADGGDESLLNTITSTVPGNNCPPGSTDPACRTMTRLDRVPGLALSKVASRQTANPGESVQYTVTVANTGEVDYAEGEATFTDDLTQVLDDATYNQDAVASTGTVFFQPTVVIWRAALKVGQTATVTYSVTVNNPDTGDHILRNAISSPTPGNTCPTPANPGCMTETRTSGLGLSKVASRQTANPGETIQYTVTVTNTGQVDYPAGGASFTDSLAQVLDDATYNNDATASGGTVSYQPGVVSWSGPVPIGQSVTVTYSVTVNNPDTGDHILRNAVSSSVPGNNCQPNSTDPACMSTTRSSGMALAKTSSTQEVNPGGRVSYTVTVTNTGQVDYADGTASFSDDLSKVLDDATYNNDGTASGGAVQFQNNILTWSGPLAVGTSVTVTYSVTVNDPDTGDKIIANAVTSTVPGNNCTPGSADPACKTTTRGSELTLAKTSDAVSAEPGAKVSYTVTVTNSGQVDYSGDTLASFTDDLSKVLDDATYNNDAAASAGQVSVVNGVVAWVGPVLVGQSVTVTYSVTINDPDTGDKIIANVVTSSIPGNNCKPGSTNPACGSTIRVASAAFLKTSDMATAEPGEIVSYTVTVTNTGQVDYTDQKPVTFDDDLATVLDDATYNDDAEATAGEVVVTDGVVTWTGPVPVGGTVTVTYSVTVNDPDEGDHLLTNAITSILPGNNCRAESTDEACKTVTKTSGLMLAKTSSAAEVDPGAVVTYTVTVTNTGQVDYVDDMLAAFSDDLATVIDDATYNDDAEATAGEVKVEEDVVSWSGPVLIGESVTVTYSVTVNDPDTGDHLLTNAVLSDIPGSNCKAESTDEACKITTKTSSIALEKKSTGESVKPGDKVTYTVTVRNTGQVAYTDEKPATFTDDLSKVLDDATYNNDAQATTGSVSLTGTTLSWSGPVAVESSVTVTYSVKVNNPNSGDRVLLNAVLSDIPGNNCKTGTTDPNCGTSDDVALAPPPPPPPGSPDLVDTGANVLPLLAVGLGLAGLGGLALLWSRRRNRTEGSGAQ
ncbi:DUF7927 domain-containing protein [Actinokineospora sp.]|uniref:DUF7927 domain-containing protein n=1 Tax=Actinokineospora sp. TaxID=1872133 RepID=UPI0040383B64